MLTQPGNGVTQGIFQAVIEAIEVGMSFIVSIDQAIALGNGLTELSNKRSRCRQRSFESEEPSQKCQTWICVKGHPAGM